LSGWSVPALLGTPEKDTSESEPKAMAQPEHVHSNSKPVTAQPLVPVSENAAKSLQHAEKDSDESSSSESDSDDSAGPSV
jgi:hypothetical protein